jgi:hypothetical protein
MRAEREREREGERGGGCCADKKEHDDGRSSVV